MKYIRNIIVIILLVIFLFPSLVIAKDTCDNSIIVKNISLNNTKGFSKENTEANVSNNIIYLDLKMYDEGDTSIYNITVENTSTKDYYVIKNSLNLDDNYLEYNLLSDDNVIKSKEEKTIQLEVKYKNKIPEENYENTNKISIKLSDKPLINPSTNMKYTYIIMMFMVLILSILIKKKNKNTIIVLIGFITIIPISTLALCTINLEVEATIKIDEIDATFLSGTEVNEKMKVLSGNDISSASSGFLTPDINITSIKHSSIEPNETEKQERNIVSTNDSNFPIYMWYENGTIYWWSKDEHPSLNEDSSYMFVLINNLNDIQSVADFDIKNVSTLEAYFVSTAITDISALENWDISNVQNISFIFQNTFIKNANSLMNWDTSNITDMSNVFCEDKELEDVSAIKNWDVSNVKSMRHMFDKCYSLEIIDLSNWTTNSLENINGMFGMFFDNNNSVGKLKKIILSKKFDTSKVTDISYFLYHNLNLESYSFLEYLDVSNVENFHCLFAANYNLISSDLDYIKNWNTTNARDMSNMFSDLKSLEELDISNFDTSKVTNFSYMFSNSTKLRHIYVGEKWDTSANTGETSVVFPSSSYLPNFNTSNTNYKDLSYAHTGEGGYLTLKTN